MKFLADMGIALQTAAWLRRLGHDAVHLSEQGLERLADNSELLLDSRVVDRSKFHLTMQHSPVVNVAPTC